MTTDRTEDPAHLYSGSVPALYDRYRGPVFFEPFAHDIVDRLVDLLERQHMFFVATSASEGRVNVAPKGMDTLRVVDPDRII